MNILLDENLRKLRTSRGNRQEDLANHLGVSVQSVSKWERGENLPDLTLIPAIASYYDVTVDDLLGVGEVRKQEKIDWYFAESKRLLHDGKPEKNIELMRKAVKEFPNEYKLIAHLAFSLFFGYFGNRDYKPELSESIELDEKILRESTDAAIRENSIQRLCLSYNHLGDKAKAREYAEMGLFINNSKEVLLSYVLDGEEGDKHNKKLIELALSLIINTINKLDSVDWLTRHEFRIKLLELFFEDDFMGHFAGDAAQYHYYSAVIYAGKGDAEKVRYHLESTVKYSKQLESLDGEYAFHSKILDGYKNNTGRYIINSEQSWTEMIFKMLTVNDSEAFAPYSNTDWFKAAVEELKACTK